LTVADNFGIATYAIILFLLTIWWSQMWGDATACPYTHMEDMIEGRTTPRDVALKTWAQLMGGCCVWRFVQFFWWLELAETHKGKAFEDCSADLQVTSTSLETFVKKFSLHL
jgi:aquaporin related protein